MQFLYFLPGVGRDVINPADITDAGLHDILRDRMTQTDLSGNGRLAVASVNNGPAGLNGTILQCVPEDLDEPDEDAPPVPAPGYYPAKHTWEKVGKYWVGYDPKDLPKPEELERDQLVGASELTLGDNRIWLAPKIRMQEGGHVLPDTWKLVQGKFVSMIKDDWAWAWDLSAEIWDWFTGQTAKTSPELFQWCVKLLSINYRVGPLEAGLLGLLGSRECRPLLCRAIGGLILDEAARQKKVSAAVPLETGVNSTAGVAGSSLDSPQPEQTST
jgi:hypothetical protein